MKAIGTFVEGSERFFFCRKQIFLFNLFLILLEYSIKYLIDVNFKDFKENLFYFYKI